ncbi:MAG: class I mannose-6-phosphate isomerase [Erysipelotrichaceae bacterium]|nr:class I mannose-6-phosphate isomerase [Erysipelotrichaceae bacterium]
MKPNFVLRPSTVVKGFDDAIYHGYSEIVDEIKKHIIKEKTIITVDCSDGVDTQEIIDGFDGIRPQLIIESQDIFYETAVMNSMMQRYLTDDRVFGIAYTGKWLDFVDPIKLNSAKQMVEKATGIVLLVGVGAGYINPGDIKVMADMTIWELQMRYRKDGIANFNAKNFDDESSKKFKRGYFMDWRLSTQRKGELLKSFDFYLDTVNKNDPRMITRIAFEEGLKQLLQQPFRTVPFFDEGLWGGHWMEKTLGVDDPTLKNTAWDYNCLFPENEVNLTYGKTTINVPGYTLCQEFPKQLIGEKGYARFGADYPIRFDFLDTMGGGSLSLQVHPDTKYFQEHFAMPFTQDESYYFLDCAPENTFMYLGLTDECNREEMERDLKLAEQGEIIFPAEKYSNKIPVKKHEHYHIPAGTVHCSGENTMVLEISSAPCIFTFKLWDWGRTGMDGQPRPINIDRGMEVIQWDKKKEWMEKECAFKPILLAQGEGWREERTGLQQYEFIETRRYWQSVKTTHRTNNETQVLNLIDGREALLESPTGQFEPYIMHFAETVVIPALISEYTITPHGESEGQEIAVMKAYIRF